MFKDELAKEVHTDNQKQVCVKSLTKVEEEFETVGADHTGVVIESALTVDPGHCQKSQVRVHEDHEMHKSRHEERDC